jgi:hypothetical protein
VSLLRNVDVVFFRRQAAERRQLRALSADISLPGTHNTADIYFPDFLLAPDKEDSSLCETKSGGREGSNCVTNIYTQRDFLRMLLRHCRLSTGPLLPPHHPLSLRHLTLLLMGSNPAVLHDRLSCYPHLLVMSMCVWA